MVESRGNIFSLCASDWTGLRYDPNTPNRWIEYIWSSQHKSGAFLNALCARVLISPVIFLYYEVLIRSKDAADVVDDASCGPWVPEQNLQLNRLIHGIFETFGVLIERLLDLRIFYSQIMGVLSVDLLTSFKFKKGQWEKLQFGDKSAAHHYSIDYGW